MVEPRSKRNASPASADAAATAERQAGPRGRAALRVYATGLELTADECASRLHLQPLQLRPRVSNLLQAGFLEVVEGKQRPTAFGTPADVLRISENGRRFLAGTTGVPR